MKLQSESPSDLSHRCEQPKACESPWGASVSWLWVRLQKNWAAENHYSYLPPRVQLESLTQKSWRRFGVKFGVGKLLLVYLEFLTEIPGRPVASRLHTWIKRIRTVPSARRNTGLSFPPITSEVNKNRSEKAFLLLWNACAQFSNPFWEFSLGAYAWSATRT